MYRVFAGLILSLVAGGYVFAADAPDAWPRWRGPEFNGVARGDAPLTWSDRDHIAWKVPVPGKGHSSPVIWGNRLFLTTAIPTGNASAAASADPAPAMGRRGPGGGSGPQAEQKLNVMAFDRATGKTIWEKTAAIATPHEGYHSKYGSFASNSLVVDSKHVIAFFGSRGVYCYTHDGQPVWEKDFGIKLRMLMAFGEGSSPRSMATNSSCCSITRAILCWWRWTRTTGANCGARRGRRGVLGQAPW